MRTCSSGSICGVRVVELFAVRCFPGTDADPATLPGGNWFASHQRSATLHRWLARWSLFGNVESPSLQFLCQLRFLSDTGCPVTGALASGSRILYNLFLWGKTCVLLSMPTTLLELVVPKFEVVSYRSISGEMYLPTCPGKTHFSSY